MKFSTREDYGLILAGKLAEKYGEGPISLKEISKEEKLSFLYLEQLATKLKKANLIKSKRGAGGGYELALDPKKIKVAEVVKVLEKPVRLVKCDHLSGLKLYCPRVTKCLTRHLWLYLHQDIMDTLEKISLADLIKNKFRLHV